MAGIRRTIPPLIRAVLACLAASGALCSSASWLLIPSRASEPAQKVAQAASGAQSGERIGRLEEELQRALRRGRPEEEADALYDLAKAYFEAGEVGRAEDYMRQSLQKESALKRTDAAIRTRVALATILVTAHRAADANQVYQEALDIAEKNERQEQAASIVDSMGTLALVSGRLDDAEKFFMKARELAKGNDAVDSQANALVNLAVVERARNQLPEAMELLNQAANLIKDSQNDRLQEAVLLETGRAQADMGRLDEAAATYEKVASLYKEDLDEVSQGKALLSLGQVYLTQENLKDAERVLREASGLLSSQSGQPIYIDTLIALGAAEAGTGHFAEADALHAKALELARKASDKARERAVICELGYDYLQKGSPEVALNKFLQARELLGDQELTAVKTKAILLADAAMCYKALGQVQAAIANYEQAVTNFDRAGDSAGKAMALNSLAVAYLDSGKFPEFERYYGQAKDLFKAASNKRGEALLAYNLAQYDVLQGHFADSVPLYEESLANFRAAHDSKGEGQVLRGLGLAHLYLGRAGKSLEYYQQALPLAEASGSIEAQWDCALGMGKAYKVLGQTDKAVEYLERAVALVEKERSQLTRDTFKTFNMDLRQDCFGELVDALAKLGKAGESLEMAERGRARAFLDLLEGRRTRRPNEELAQSSLPLPMEGAGGSGALSPRLAQLRVAEPGSRGIEVVPRASATVEASTISPINALPPTLDEIKSIVKKSGSTVLEYYVLPDKILTWVVHPDGTIEMPPPTVTVRRRLSEKIAATYRSIIAAPKSPDQLKTLADQREANLKELYGLLVEPALPLLPKDPSAIITVVPHGTLFLVPFAALMDAHGHYLIEDHTLSYAPAVGVLRATEKLNAELTGEKDKLLAFGNPITKAIAFLGALPYAEKEVEHVADLFGADRSTVKIGESANKANFVGLAPKSTIIHLATHGLINEERPMESALVLAPQGTDDGLLTVKDILQLPQLKSRLVVLSACQTGRGKITGDGVVGLSRSFIIAGTPAVLVSQWNVDDVMTEYQMVAFYKSFLKGTGKASSLREAQLKTIGLMERRTGQEETRQAGVARANPRYWAAFQLIGECQ